MRRIIILFLWTCLGFTAFSQPLLDYKNSVHPLFVGFLVGDGNDPSAATSLLSVPDSVDIVEMFAGYDTLRADWRAIQAKGTRIVRCVFPNSGYFDGSVRDPATKLPGYVRPPGLDSLKPVAGSTYEHYARDLYQLYIMNYHWDGLDVDIESGTFSGDIPRANASVFLQTIARYFGPTCTSCVVAANGKKPLLIYDTDGSAHDEVNFTPFKSNYDYVFFQSYTGGNRYWRGKGVANFPPLVAMYGIDKFVPLVNGDDWVRPNGSQDEPPGGDSGTTASLLSYARWCRENGGRGVGAYRMSRDYNHMPPFGASREAIQIMNPAGRKAP